MKNISTLLIAVFLLISCQSDDLRTSFKEKTSTAKSGAEKAALGNSPANFSDNEKAAGEIKTTNILTNKEKAEGWRMLYDGKTKNGWHVYLNATDGSAWKAIDGMLYLDALELDGWQSKGGGDLVTDSIYENFHLYLEWMISEGGNSGVLFNVQEDPTYEYSWYTGPEMQLLDNIGNPDGQVITRRAGDLVGIMKSTKEPAHGPGRWNSTDIRVEHGKLDLFMNGKQILSTRINDGYWRKTIKDSEFRYYDDFGAFIKGRIALQDHGSPVWFRNIRIREL